MASCGTSRMPWIPVSWGELMDKIAILEIKAERISEPTRAAHAQAELQLLLRVRDAHLPNRDAVQALYAQLQRVNERIWDLEARVRRYEREQSFGEGFIETARAVHTTNDRRSWLKQQLDRVLDSELKEEKEYAS